MEEKRRRSELQPAGDQTSSGTHELLVSVPTGSGRLKQLPVLSVNSYILPTIFTI